MYKAIFKRKMYKQIPSIIVAYYNKSWGGSWAEQTYNYRMLFDANEKLHGNLEISGVYITDRSESDNPLIKEKVIDDYLHVLKVGDIIDIFDEKLSVINVTFNSDNSIEYQLESGDFKPDDYALLLKNKEEEMKLLKEALDNQEKEDEIEPVKKKEWFFSKWFK